MTHAANIHMNKTGGRVVTDPAAMERKRRIAQLGRGHAGNANINRAPFHVLAVQSNCMPVLAQVVVRPWRAVSTDDIDHTAVVPQLHHEVMQQVEFPYIIIFDITGAAVAKKAIEFGHRRGKISIADAVNHIDARAGMKIVEPKAITVGRSHRGV